MNVLLAAFESDFQVLRRFARNFSWPLCNKHSFVGTFLCDDSPLNESFAVWHLSDDLPADLVRLGIQCPCHRSSVRALVDDGANQLLFVEIVPNDGMHINLAPVARDFKVGCDPMRAVRTIGFDALDCDGRLVWPGRPSFDLGIPGADVRLEYFKLLRCCLIGGDANLTWHG